MGTNPSVPGTHAPLLSPDTMGARDGIGSPYVPRIGFPTSGSL